MDQRAAAAPSSKNPFGFSSQNLGSLYKGLVKDAAKSFKHLRKTAHTHDPVDDVRGNAEALLAMQKQGLAINPPVMPARVLACSP